MGRYMRKNKVSMEVSQSLGVRTRARTLAMAQQQAASRKNLCQEQQVNVLNFCYLELRSRKLEKLCEIDPSTKRGGGGAASKSSARPPKTQQRRVRSSDAIGVVSVGAAPLSRSNSFTSSKQPPPPAPPSLKNDDLDALHHVDSARTSGQLEVSCGDNAFDHDGLSSRDSLAPENHRRLRESTPVCTDQEHHQRIADAPGSTTKVRVTNNRTPSNPPEESSRPFDAPTPEEIEEFFAAGGEQEPDEEKKRLSDRYNYDFANDCPLPGRFEWTSASS